METETTGTISLSPETEEFHLLGQHDQKEHAWNRGQGRTSGVDSGPDAKKETSQSRLVVKETENHSNRLRKVALGLAAIGVAAGLIYIARKTAVGQVGKKVTKDVTKNVADLTKPVIKPSSVRSYNDITKKATNWSEQTGIGGKTLASTRKISKVGDVGPIGRWLHENGVGLYKRKFQITAADGQKLDLYDMDGALPERVHKELLNSLSSMHEMYPLKTKPKILVVNRQVLKEIRPNMVHADAFVIVDRDNPFIFINADAMKGRPFETTVSNLMPGAKNTSKNHYILTHEYGHKVDMATGMRSAGGEKGLWADVDVQDGLSEYGNSIPEEGYAEAFAEWHVTQGKTDNFAAKTYAYNEGWFGGGKAFSTATEQVSNTGDRIVRTPEGAKLFGVPIGQV